MSGRSDALPDGDVSALHMTSGLHEGKVTANEVVRSLVKNSTMDLALERKNEDDAASATSSATAASTSGGSSRATASSGASAIPKSAPQILELGEPDVALFERVHRVSYTHSMYIEYAFAKNTGQDTREARNWLTGT